MQIVIMSVKECANIKDKRQKLYSNATYMIMDGDQVIYIGKTWRTVPQRLREHLKKNYSWILFDVKIEIHTPGVDEKVTRTEARLIKELQPKKNKLLL